MFEDLKSIRFFTQTKISSMNRNLLALIFTFISFHLFAQPGMYFNISGGYGAPALQQTQQGITFEPTSTDPAESIIVPLINQNISDSADMRYKTNLYQGYTSGGALNLVVGYFINPYVGFEIGFSTLLAQKIHGSSTFDGPFSLGKNVTINTTTWSYGITMSPGIRLHACRPDAKVVPYGRFALSLPFWGRTIHELDIQSKNFFNQGRPARAQVRAETQSIFSIGFNGSIGVGYNITKWVRIFGEVAAQYLFVRSGQTALTRYDLTFDGETNSTLDEYKTFSKVTKFVDKLDENSNTTLFGKKRNYTNEPQTNEFVDESKPREELRRAANFSAFGGMIGLAFTIDNKLLKKKKNKQPVPVHQ